MPERVVPMLATAGELPSDDDAFAYEIKWDGVRAMSYIRGGTMHVESRNLNDITNRYPEILPLAEALDGRAAVLDGEVVAFDESGRPSFGHLQRRMHLANEWEVRQRMGEVPIAYVLFDVLWADGRNTMSLPYTERRRVLSELVPAPGPCWQVATTYPGHGAELLAAAEQQRLEGIVAKRAASVYEPGKRSRNWLKIKLQRTQEFVIAGWVPGEGHRTGKLGALLLGYYDDTGLRFAGKVGTGFSEKVLRALGEQLAALARPDSPFVDAVPWKLAHFVDPELIAEVEYTEWTQLGTLRHPSFKGLRDDKDPTDVHRDL
ncbi:MAG: bifunctional non-ous end joining protein LigD [Actinomycetota bacterium]|jgi:bifunctional non-homologous end joining protein LigD|nr:bifunctional non-ous end joining protein LigD [Actinomycetota bacterium]